MTVADIPAGFDTLAATRALEARMDERFAEFEARMDKCFAEFEARMDRRFAELEARMDERFAEFEARMDGRFAELEARMLKVAISIVLAQTALTVGLTFGLLKLFGGAP